MVEARIIGENDMAEDKCWLCGQDGADTTIVVECDVPNGKHTEPHEVKVHFGCYLDIES